MTDFTAFAQGYGLILNHPIADGRWHSCPTERKPRKKQGRYRWDGRFGVVGDFALGFWESYKGENGEVSARDMRRLRDARQDESRRHAEARRTAQALLDESTMCQHPYLARKGFPKARGFVHPSGDLLIPMRDIQDYTHTLNGVQRISPDGTKKFLPGMKAKGSVFKIGSKGQTWLAEGFVTAETVFSAIRALYQEATVIVCFSAGNLQHISQYIRPPAFCFADHDASEAGELAAKATGFPYCMWSELGDADDMMLATNLRAVATLIRETQDKAAGY